MLKLERARSKGRIGVDLGSLFAAAAYWTGPATFQGFFLLRALGISLEYERAGTILRFRTIRYDSVNEDDAVVE